MQNNYLSKGKRNEEIRGAKCTRIAEFSPLELNTHKIILLLEYSDNLSTKFLNYYSKQFHNETSHKQNQYLASGIQHVGTQETELSIFCPLKGLLFCVGMRVAATRPAFLVFLLNAEHSARSSTQTPILQRSLKGLLPLRHIRGFKNYSAKGTREPVTFMP